MTPETAAQTLRQQAEYWSKVDGPHPMREGAIEIAKALQMGADALDAQGWRPIESAPKDGTHLVGIDSEGCVARLWWHRGQRYFDNMDATGDVVGWMPLPTPPEEPSRGK